MSSGKRESYLGSIEIFWDDIIFHFGAACSRYYGWLSYLERKTLEELEIIEAAGLKVFPIYQTYGGEVSYFTRYQGQKDAYAAKYAAQSFGFPSSTTIYFAVDYDALMADITSNIIPYFRGIREVAGESVSIDARAVVALLYMGIFCTGAAHLLWNESLSMVEAGICSAFYPVQPLVSVILGILFLHENITTSFVIGCVVIVIGVLVCILKKKD